MKLDEVYLHHRVDESPASRRHETGLDFLHGYDVLALEGRKEGGEISSGHRDLSQKKSEWPVYERELKGKGEERHGIVVGLPRENYQDDDIKHLHRGFL